MNVLRYKERLSDEVDFHKRLNTIDELKVGKLHDSSFDDDGINLIPFRIPAKRSTSTIQRSQARMTIM
jgi:hypothetical protein